MNRPDDIRALADKLHSLLPDDVSPAIVLAVRPPTIAEILHAVANYYGVSEQDIRHRKERHSRVCWARHVVCYLARALTRRSHNQVTTRLGGFHHTVSYYGFVKVDGLARERERVRDDIDILRLRLADTVLNRGATCH